MANIKLLWHCGEAVWKTRGIIKLYPPPLASQQLPANHRLHYMKRGRGGERRERGKGRKAGRSEERWDKGEEGGAEGRKRERGKCESKSNDGMDNKKGGKSGSRWIILSQKKGRKKGSKGRMLSSCRILLLHSTSLEMNFDLPVPPESDSDDRGAELFCGQMSACGGWMFQVGIF